MHGRLQRQGLQQARVAPLPPNLHQRGRRVPAVPALRQGPGPQSPVSGTQHCRIRPLTRPSPHAEPLKGAKKLTPQTQWCPAFSLTAPVFSGELLPESLSGHWKVRYDLCQVHGGSRGGIQRRAPDVLEEIRGEEEKLMQRAASMCRQLDLTFHDLSLEGCQV